MGGKRYQRDEFLLPLMDTAQIDCAGLNTGRAARRLKPWLYTEENSKGEPWEPKGEDCREKGAKKGIFQIRVWCPESTPKIVHAWIPPESAPQKFWALQFQIGLWEKDTVRWTRIALYRLWKQDWDWNHNPQKVRKDMWSDLNWADHLLKETIKNVNPDDFKRIQNIIM